jgi:hypothetical protein
MDGRVVVDPKELERLRRLEFLVRNFLMKNQFQLEGARRIMALIQKDPALGSDMAKEQATAWLELEEAVKP